MSAATRRFADHPLTWTTTHDDVIEVSSKPGADGRLNWKWKRYRSDTGEVMAVSKGPLRRKQDVIWHARRINPPHPWIDPRVGEPK